MSIPSARRFHTAALCAIAACGLALPVVAGAQECHQKSSNLDVEGNGDGQISASRHMGDANKRFELMDTNKDKKITGAEINASHGAESITWAGRRLSSDDKIRELDADDDGELTAPEYAIGSQKMFEKLDADGNGFLTSGEMSAGF